MTNERMEQILREALAPVIPTESFNQRLKAEMEEKSMKEKGRKEQKGFSMKKAALATAVCCLLAGTVGVASSGSIKSVIGHSIPARDIKNYGDMGKLEQEAGFAVRDTEGFQNGYAFKKAGIADLQDLDENDNTVASYKEIDVTYENGEGKTLHFAAEEAVHVKQRGNAKKVAEIRGVPVSYHVDTYQWVPEGYELTPEDEENLKREDYYISEGADTLSVGTVSGVSWVQDGIYYRLFAYETLSEKELFTMAEELIAQP